VFFGAGERRRAFIGGRTRRGAGHGPDSRVAPSASVCFLTRMLRPVYVNGRYPKLS
jgi:hypothetical protein